LDLVFGKPPVTDTAPKRLGHDLSRLSPILDVRLLVMTEFGKP